jgi:hypothetical protein
MPWMICKQTPYNQIKVLEESGKTSYPSYNEFLKNLLVFPIRRRQDFKTALDRFEIMIVNLDDGEWEIKKQELHTEEATFEDLCKVNPSNINEEEKEKTKMENMLDKGHSFINKWKGDWKFYD